MISDLEKQLKLLKQYNKALEDQNKCRNQQRKVLQAQIHRLTTSEKTKTFIKQGQCSNCKFNKIQNQRLKKTLQTLQSSKLMFQKKINQLEEQLQKSARNLNQSKLNRISSKPLPNQISSKNQFNSEQLLEQNQQLRNKLQQKVFELSIKERQLKNVQQSQQNKAKQYNQSIKQLSCRLQQMQKSLNQAGNFNQSSKYLETQNQQLMQQIKNLQKLVTSYSENIKNLSQQLQYYKNGGNKSRNRQFTQQLQSQFRNISNINKILTQKMQDQTKLIENLQNRIIGLERKNINLQSELKYNSFNYKNIQESKSIKNSPQKELNNLNGVVNQQNDKNNEQLKEMIKQLQKDLNKLNPFHNSQASEIDQRKVSQSSDKYSGKHVTHQSTLSINRNFNSTDGFNTQTRKLFNSTEKTGTFSPMNTNSKILINNQLSNGKMNSYQLQLRIKELRNENQHLKKKLYHHR